jgi:outer membrane protein OmpA-like peptidoglycan-associated protein
MRHMRTTQRLLAGGLALSLVSAGLSGCGLLFPKSEETDTTILFSHSEPAPPRGIPQERSPSMQWTGPAATEAPPERTAEAAQAAQAELEVYFAVDSAELSQEDKVRIDEWMRTLEARPQAKLLISGHTDVTYTREHNAGLSMRRAQVVARYLADRGLDRQRMRIDAFGPDQPQDTNDTDAGRARNRRTKVSIDTQS